MKKHDSYPTNDQPEFERWYPSRAEGLDVGDVWQDENGETHRVTGLVGPESTTPEHNEGDIFKDPVTEELRIYTTEDRRRDHPGVDLSTR
jgi:hypothetical protein